MFRSSAHLLGLLTDELGNWFHHLSGISIEARSEVSSPTLRTFSMEEVSNKILEVLGERQSARKNKDFARSDAIRDGLAAAGVIVMDTPQGAEWKLSPDFDAARLEEIGDV